MSNQLNPFASPQSAPEPGYANWATSHPAALGRVKMGLTLVYGSICALILVSLAMPFAFMTLRIGRGGESIALLLGAAFLLLTLVMFAGMILCVAVPPESGAKTFAIAAVVFQAIAYTTSALVGIPAVAGFQLLPLSLGGILVMIGNLTTAISLVCFVLFMRRLALFIVRYDVAGRATRVLVVGGIVLLLIAVGTAMNMLNSALPAELAQVPGLLVTIGGIGGLVTFIMYANTVTYLRKAITN